MNRIEKGLAFVALTAALSGCSWLSKPEILEALPEPVARPQPPEPRPEPGAAGAVGAAMQQRGGPEGARPMPAAGGGKSGGG